MAVASSTAALLGAAVTFASTAVGTWSAVSRQEEQRKQAASPIEGLYLYA